MNMNNNCGCCSPCCSEWLYTIFRVIVGGIFMWHGIVKLMAWATMPTLFQVLGIVETVVGALVLLGLFTRYAAIVGGLVMIAALIKAHLSQSWIFVGQGANGGEPALLLLGAFLAIIAYGSGKFALQNLFYNCCDCHDECAEGGCCDHDHSEHVEEVVVEETKAPVHKVKKKARR